MEIAIDPSVFELLETGEEAAFNLMLNYVESKQSDLGVLDIDLENILGVAEWAGHKAEPLVLIRFLKATQILFEIHGLWDQAMTLGYRVVEHGRHMDNDWMLASAYLVLGRLLTRQRRYAEARSFLDQSLMIWEMLGDETNVSHCLTELGGIALSQKQHNEAQAFYERASIVLRQTIARDFIRLGVVSEMQGSLSSAIEDFQAGLEVARAINDHRLMAEASRYLGQLELRKGDYQLAKNYYQDSIEFSSSVGDNVGLNESFYFLGLILEEEGDYESAKKTLSQGLKIAQLLRDNQRVADYQFRLANIAFVQRDNSTARGLYLAVVQARRSANDSPSLAQALSGLGTVLIETEELRDAERYLRESFGLSQTIGDHKETVSVLLKMGEIAFRQGSISEARLQWQRARQLAESKGLTNMVEQARAQLLRIGT